MTQSVNYGQVPLTPNQATQIVAANANRVKLYINLNGAGYIGTNNLVTSSNGFQLGNSTIWAGLISGLDWQSAVYGYATQPGIVAYYIEEIVV